MKKFLLKTRVLIIGGGITGTGLARDLSMRGIQCVLAEKKDGHVTVFTVGSKSHGLRFDIDEFVENNIDKISLPRNRIHTKVVTGGNVESTILAEAESKEENYDLVVLGCTRDPLIYHFARESVPERVARRCSKPIVMAKASGGIKSFLKRWF